MPERETAEQSQHAAREDLLITRQAFDRGCADRACEVQHASGHASGGGRRVDVSEEAGCRLEQSRQLRLASDGYFLTPTTCPSRMTILKFLWH